MPKRSRLNSPAFVAAALVASLVSAGAHGAEAQARVLIDADRTRPGEMMAAAELGSFLARLYPRAEFEVGARPGAAIKTHMITVGTKSAQSGFLQKLLDDRKRSQLERPGSYVVFTDSAGGGSTACIVGADLEGLWHGVYRLLERLGCGFYLSFDTLPDRKPVAFSLDGWEMSDQPLAPVRMVFNWHNFLSGCSTWNAEHWQQWIAQSQKMGYNAVMVHAYGNNPMAGFRFRGKDKPVGYLSSTRVGRDWSTNHVSDVRRLWGGEVFKGPVFGSDAAIEGTDAERTEAAQRMMAEVFAFAEQRSVDVYFAVDVDTTSANPQELIGLLPEHARFEIDVPGMAWMGQEAGRAFLVNPETPEGYAFYKAQVEHLLNVYPQIDCLVVWHRKGGTPWMTFRIESMPRAWQEEYRAELAKTPGAEKLWHAHHLFAQSKIVRACQRAVAELGREDVEIAFGSWDFNFLPAADRFMPEGVALIPLDWMVLRDQSIFDTAERRASVAEVASHRPVVPIAWAHHDDGNYVGRPYEPYAGFFDRLSEMKCEDDGYGIIHWTTKPLDLYFKSLVNQVWTAGRNEPLEATCRRMAWDLVGPSQAGPMAEYLHAWVTTMPKIGRETSDFFIDHELPDLPGVEAGHLRRMKLLEAIDRPKLSAPGREWVDYFRGLEHYVLGIYRTEDLFNRAKRQFAQGDLDAARATMAKCRPERVIEDFAQFSQMGGLTRGEEGLIVSMNTRWLAHYVRFRQQLGTEPVRYNFAATSHDPLAQSRGVFTFHFDPQRNVWQTLGAEETGAEVFSLPDSAEPSQQPGTSAADGEICRSGIESEGPLDLVVAPIMRRDSRGRRYSQGTLPPGPYRLRLLMIDPASSGPGQRVFEVQLRTSGGRRAVYLFDTISAKYLRIACNGNSANAWNSIHEVSCPALVRDASAASASGEKQGYEAAKAIDGRADTRWAVEGKGHWIQFRLDPDKPFDRLAINWYEGDRRTYAFDLSVSEDGKTWTKLDRQTGRGKSLVTDRIDIVELAGGANRVLEQTYEVALDAPGVVEVRLVPERGKALLCGLELAPVPAPAEPPK